MYIYFNQNTDIIAALRRAGYGQIRNGSFVRRLGRFDYPRFHAYLESGHVSLHLDQKQASYEGYKAHSGEADSEVVIAEGERIKNVITDITVPPTREKPVEENKNFWNKLFG